MVNDLFWAFGLRSQAGDGRVALFGIGQYVFRLNGANSGVTLEIIGVKSEDVGDAMNVHRRH